MLVRLTEPALISGSFRQPGELWDLDPEEAAVLLEQGRAVPVSRDLIDREVRSI